MHINIGLTIDLGINSYKLWTDNRLGILMHTKHWTANRLGIIMHTSIGLTIDWGY